jgi:hypothetical protein
VVVEVGDAGGTTERDDGEPGASRALDVVGGQASSYRDGLPRFRSTAARSRRRSAPEREPQLSARNGREY